MASYINREKLKAFMIRRRINSFGLFVITVMSALTTLVCALTGLSSSKLDILIFVTLAFVALCFLQAFKMRKSFRTIRSFKGMRKKRKQA